MGQGKRIGYIRVSTSDQNPERQLEHVTLDKRFIDYASAKSTNRPQLQAMLEFVREDDIVVIHSMDRLARNLKDLKELVEGLVERNIQVQFIKENLQFSKGTSSLANLMLHMMGAFAEFEHEFILERQREGIAIAKKKGRYEGRERKLKGEQLEILKKELATCKKRSQISKDLGISRATMYHYMKRLGIPLR